MLILLFLLIFNVSCFSGSLGKDINYIKMRNDYYYKPGFYKASDKIFIRKGKFFCKERSEMVMNALYEVLSKQGFSVVNDIYLANVEVIVSEEITDKLSEEQLFNFFSLKKQNIGSHIKEFSNITLKLVRMGDHPRHRYYNEILTFEIIITAPRKDFEEKPDFYIKDYVVKYTREPSKGEGY